MTVEENNLRELLHAATPHLGGVDVDLIAARVRPTGPQHHRAGRWAIAAAVTVVLAVAAGIAIAHRGATPRLTSTSPRNYSQLVLRNGDTVTASGQVVALPHQPIQMCDPYTATPFTTPAPGADIEPCGTGIDVVGVDLAGLTSRHAAHGAISGTTTVTGTYRDGRIIVTAQSAFTNQNPLSLPETNFHQSPCPPPAGGWPKSRQPLLDQVAAYGRAHPGAIVTSAVLQPTPSASIAYVLTAGDPAPVRRALAGTLSYGLCVVRSAYTQQQIDAASRAFAPSPDNGITATGADGLNRTLQPQVTVSMRQLTPELAALASRQPTGLVQLSIWLTPKP